MPDPKLTPRKEPRQPRARATVDALVIAAEQLTREQGLDSWTTNHIADRAGASIGSLYQYFPSKESLLVALYLHRRATYREVLATALASVAKRGTPREIATSIAKVWFDAEPPAIDWPFDHALRAHLIATNAERKLVASDKELGNVFGQVLERRGWATAADAAARGGLVLATIERLLVAHAREPALRTTLIEILAATLGPST
jgi:AcrR family transcriptional regulator